MAHFGEGAHSRECAECCEGGELSRSLDMKWLEKQAEVSLLRALNAEQKSLEFILRAKVSQKHAVPLVCRTVGYK